MPFDGEPFEIGFNPEFLRDGLESVGSERRRAEADQPAAPGPDRVGRRQRLPLPDHADPPERLRPPWWSTRLRLRDFRSYAAAEVGLGERLTVVHGPNGAGKTNLLEALYFGCTGRSCRTTNERELVRFDAGAGRAVRVEVHGRDRDGEHELSVGFQPGEAKRVQVDGAPVERLLDAPHRPLVSVFLPDRLELVKGPPALRRAHLDQVVAALWPARAATRRAYGQALAQRNALLGARARRRLALGAGRLGPRARAPRHRAARRPRRGGRRF